MASRFHGSYSYAKKLNKYNFMVYNPTSLQVLGIMKIYENAMKNFKASYYMEFLYN